MQLPNAAVHRHHRLPKRGPVSLWTHWLGTLAIPLTSDQSSLRKRAAGHGAQELADVQNPRCYPFTLTSANSSTARSLPGPALHAGSSTRPPTRARRLALTTSAYAIGVRSGAVAVRTCSFARLKPCRLPRRSYPGEPDQATYQKECTRHHVRTQHKHLQGNRRSLQFHATLTAPRLATDHSTSLANLSEPRNPQK